MVTYELADPTNTKSLKQLIKKYKQEMENRRVIEIHNDKIDAMVLSIMPQFSNSKTKYSCKWECGFGSNNLKIIKEHENKCQKQRKKL